MIAADDFAACALPVAPFRVRLSETLAYWSVFDADYRPVDVADQFLREIRLGRDLAERTTQMYAGDLSRFVNWAAGRGLSLERAAAELSRFMLELRTTPIERGPHAGRVRDDDRVAVILGTVRTFYRHLVSDAVLDAAVLGALFEVGDDRWLPRELRGTDGPRTRLAPRHALKRSKQRTPRMATEEEFLALVGAAEHWRDRFLVVLLWYAGLRIGQALGLRRADLHLASQSTVLGCAIEGPHVHVIKRDNVNRADAKNRREYWVPAHPYVLRFYEGYLEEREAVRRARDSDYVFVNLFAEPIGEPMKLGGADRLLRRLSARAGLERAVNAHSLRHAAGTRWTEEGGLDVAKDLLGHASIMSTQIYNHTRPERLRAAVNAAPDPGAVPA